MKRIISLLVVALLFSLTSCIQFDETYIFVQSLDEYIERINKYERGYSNFEIDLPEYFLPSPTFFEDYKYTKGYYYYFGDESLFVDFPKPNTSLLVLEYDEKTYEQAKEYMLEKIKPYNNTRYIYDNYSFYENSNFINLRKERGFPTWFTVAGLNDEKRALVFLGFHTSTSSVLPNGRETDMEEHWTSFIDEYYGKYYDFSD